jgi:hypothetical protein
VEREPVAPVPSDEAAADYEPAAPPAEPAGWLDEELEPEPAPPPRMAESPTPVPPLEPVEPDPILDTPTQDFDALSVDEEPAPEPAAEGEDSEDVLEETPDFLQDTPEHDRLWFEQKPPRDFDFDD